nr:ABC transporter substrate-binding protein [Saccharopolyspora sp. HNM0983]
MRDNVPRIAAALVGALALTACGEVTTGPTRAPVPPPVPAEQLSDVVLQVGDQKGNQRSMLAAAGLLDTPYEIEWSTFTSGPPLVEAVSAGAVDVGGVGNTPPLFGAAASAKIKAVSASEQNSATDALLVPAGSPLRSVQDLRGKTVALAKGSSAHGNVLNMLSRAGLEPDDVDLSFMQPAEAFSAFTQGQVDAWAVWDPYTAQAELEADVRVLADGRGTANGYEFTVAAVESLGDPRKNAAIADFVARIARAEQHNTANPEERAREWAADTGLPIEVTRRAAERRHRLPVPMDGELVRSQQQLARAFLDARVLPTRFRFEDYVDRRYEQQLSAIG